jgi:hypothetical protein
MSKARMAIALSLMALSLPLVAGSADAQEVDPCTEPPPGAIVGTEGNDRLRGTPGDDLIVGLGGNDVILRW